MHAWLSGCYWCGCMWMTQWGTITQKTVLHMNNRKLSLEQCWPHPACFCHEERLFNRAKTGRDYPPCQHTPAHQAGNGCCWGRNQPEPCSQSWESPAGPVWEAASGSQRQPSPSAGVTHRAACATIRSPPAKNRNQLQHQIPTQHRKYTGRDCVPYTGELRLHPKRWKLGGGHPQMEAHHLVESADSVGKETSRLWVEAHDICHLQIFTQNRTKMSSNKHREENNLHKDTVHIVHAPECQRRSLASLQTEQSGIQQWLCSHGWPTPNVKTHMLW